MNSDADGIEPVLEGAPIGWKMPGPPKNYKKQKDPPFSSSL